jgi:hypothetical protein
MKMKVADRPRITLYEFLELVLMWHCSGDIPMDRVSMCTFIEDEHFAEFLMSVQHWCGVLGLTIPDRSDVIKTLHQLYNDPALLNS